MKNYLPKYTYNKKNPKISNKAANKQNELMRLNDESKFIFYLKLTSIKPPRTISSFDKIM